MKLTTIGFEPVGVRLAGNDYIVRRLSVAKQYEVCENYVLEHMAKNMAAGVKVEPLIGIALEREARELLNAGGDMPRRLICMLFQEALRPEINEELEAICQLYDAATDEEAIHAAMMISGKGQSPTERPSES